MSRDYFLYDPVNPHGGIKIKCKNDRDCIFCSHCYDLFWDYTNLIYMIFCDLDNDTDCMNEQGEHICDDYEDYEGGNDEQVNMFDTSDGNNGDV